MDKYIQELLKEQTRVNIPGFGAFIVSKENGTNILFNQYLNFDDGLLSGRVAHALTVDKSEADVKIKAYVQSLNAKLDAGETAVIDGVGSFVKSESGKIEFTPNPDIQSGEGIVLDFGSQSQEQGEAAPAAAQPEQPAEPQPSEPEQQATEPAASAADPTPIQSYQPEKKNNRTALIVALIVILFLIAAAICLLFINTDNAVYRFFRGEKEQIEVVPDPAPVVKDTVVVEKPDTVPPAPEPSNVNPLEKRYNIIVGSYRLEAAANKRVEQLKAKGFDKAFVTFNGNWYMAVIESHDSLVEAERRQEEIVDNYRIESWITNAGE